MQIYVKMWCDQISTKIKICVAHNKYSKIKYISCLRELFQVPVTAMDSHVAEAMLTGFVDDITDKNIFVQPFVV